jgi:uncharacterized coiled-coil protein SlyX
MEQNKQIENDEDFQTIEELNQQVQETKKALAEKKRALYQAKITKLQKLPETAGFHSPLELVIQMNDTFQLGLTFPAKLSKKKFEKIKEEVAKMENSPKDVIKKNPKCSFDEAKLIVRANSYEEYSKERDATIGIKPEELD